MISQTRIGVVPVTEETGLFKMLDEEGNEIEFEIVDAVLVDDIEYVLAAPVEPEEGEENYAYLFRIDEFEDGEWEPVPVEDDDEFERVEAAFQQQDDDLDDDSGEEFFGEDDEDS